MLQKIKNRLKDQAGLTLIELLAVIVILGIIAAIAIPSIMNVIDKSREDALRADATQILNSAKLFAASENVPASTDILWATDSVDTTYDGLVNYVDLSSDVQVSSGFKATVDANGVVTITGTIKKDSKHLNLNAAGLEDIEDHGIEATTSATF